MIKTFENYGELTADLAFDLIDRIEALGNDNIEAQFGASNQSCSAYVNVALLDDDGDEVETFKVRFSDHADRYGSDVTFRIEDVVVSIEEDGEYIETQIEEAAYSGILQEAFDTVSQKIL